MRPARATTLLLAMFGFVGRIATGCTDATDSAIPLPESGIGDAAEEGSVPDPSGDAANDAKDATPDGPRTCSGDGWCHTELPTLPPKEEDAGTVAEALDLRAVWVAPNHVAWAVANQGYVLRWSEDSGWQVVFDAETPLGSVWGTSATDIWIGGTRGFVAHGTDDGGAVRFESADLGVATSVSRIWGRSASDIWAMTESGVYRYTGVRTDAGPAFARVPFPNAVEQGPATERIDGLWGRGDDLWISGVEFTDCSLPSGANACCDSDNGCGSRLVLARWTGNAGETPRALWERTVLDNTQVIRVPLNPNLSTLTTDGLHFHISGGAFTASFLTRVAAADAGVLDASEPMTSGGYRWTVEEPPTLGTTYEGIWSSKSDDVWLVGSPGIVRHWDGTAWQVSRVSITDTLLINSLQAVDGVVDSTGKRDLWVVGKGIAMHRREGQ